MSFWEKLLGALRREQRDVAEAVDEWTDKGNAALDRRERELHATPLEKLEIEQERARENDEALEQIRRRIERGEA